MFFFSEEIRLWNWEGEVCEFENNVRLRNYGFRLLELFGYLNLLSVAAEHYVEKCNNK